MRIALLPLDERPVNTRLAVDVGAIAGADVALPPRELLPVMRRPGDADALADWLSREVLSAADASVVSLDLLCHGGLIGSRTSGHPVAAATRRLDRLRELRESAPASPIAAFSTVSRASDSYSGDEEPDYWPTYGRELHRYGAALHQSFLAEVETPAGEPTATREAGPHSGVPADIVRDFMSRRLRNHAVNLIAVQHVADGVIDPLLIVADDTARHSAGSAEQVWLRHWTRAIPTTGTILSYPGADEVGAVLTARAVAAHHRQTVTFAVVCHRAGLRRIAKFENLPVGINAELQVRAAGGQLATGDSRADVVLVIHPPDPDLGDWYGGTTRHDPDEVAGTVELVRSALADGAAVALADVRNVNGSDPHLVRALHDEGLLPRLAAYAGWNTAGNSIGSAVAAAVTTVVGQKAGTFDQVAAARQLTHRILDDHYYQAVVRPFLDVDGGSRTQQDKILRAIANGLTAGLDELTAGQRSWVLRDVALPWKRTFEVDFTLGVRTAASKFGRIVPPVESPS